MYHAFRKSGPLYSLWPFCVSVRVFHMKADHGGKAQPVRFETEVQATVLYMVCSSQYCSEAVIYCYNVVMMNPTQDL